MIELQPPLQQGHFPLGAHRCRCLLSTAPQPLKSTKKAGRFKENLYNEAMKQQLESHVTRVISEFGLPPTQALALAQKVLESLDPIALAQYKNESAKHAANHSVYGRGGLAG